MIGDKVLLDTNIVSALFKDESTVTNRIDESLEIFIPIIVIGELYYGAAYSAQVEKNISKIIALSKIAIVLPVSVETSKIYGDLKATLRKQGSPIPENDIWIAAIAKQYKLTLITRDKHFNNIAELDIAIW